MIVDNHFHENVVCVKGTAFLMYSHVCVCVCVFVCVILCIWCCLKPQNGS